MGKTFKVSDITKSGIGDVDLTAVGQPEVIEEREKLVQDILEVLLVMVGQRDVPRVSPSWGSKIIAILGYPLPAGSAETLLRGAIDEAVRKLQKLQRTSDTITDDEQITKVSAIHVTQDTSGIRYNFYLGVETRSGQTLTLQGNLR